MLAQRAIDWARRQRLPNRQTTVDTFANAPANGIVVPKDMMAVDPNEGLSSAVYLYDMIPGEYGTRVRPGTKDVATGFGAEVRTEMEYLPSDGSAARLFACTDQGIYEFTDGDQSPTLVHAWAATGGEAGWVSWENYTNAGGSAFILLCDELNGYIIFDGTTWTPTTLTGPTNPLVFIVEWNARLWFIEKDTATAWYLDPLLISGTATAVEMGSRMRSGGDLRALATWTFSGGDGVNERLAAVGAGGDLLVWTGDPDLQDFQLSGRWFVGRMPQGRRVFTDWGGDVMLLSSRGVVSIGAVLQGAATAIEDDAFVTRSIAALFRQRFQETEGLYGWGSQLAPDLGVAVFSTPTPTGGRPIQFVMDMGTKGWCTWRDRDVRSMHKTTRGLLYGDSSDKVIRFGGDVDRDDITIPGIIDPKPIRWSFLTHFAHAGTPGRWKRMQMIRPFFIAATQPSFEVRARYDFDLSECPAPSISLGLDIALWDLAVWDADLWGGTAQGFNQVRGGNGMGRHFAIAMKGQSASQTTLVGYSLLGDEGGLL